MMVLYNCNYTFYTKLPNFYSDLRIIKIYNFLHNPVLSASLCNMSAAFHFNSVYSFIYQMVSNVNLQILDAMNQDSGIPLTSLQVDGGMSQNSLLMQLQTDLLGIPVSK